MAHAEAEHAEEQDIQDEGQDSGLKLSAFRKRQKYHVSENLSLFA